MKISVVIPMHNAADYIARALRSVAEQAHGPEEVIVVDDASTDGSADVVRRVMPEAVVVASDAGNAAAARNVGIERARGRWVAFLDADDWWKPEHLQRFVEVMSTEAAAADVAYLTTHDVYRMSTGRTVVRELDVDGAVVSGLTDHDFLLMFSKSLALTTTAVIARRDRLQAVEGFDPGLRRRHDIDLWLRLIHDQRWTYNPCSTVVYRADTPGSLSRASVEAERYFLRALLKNREWYGGEAMDRLVRCAARRAMAAAFTDGDAADRQAAREAAWEHLSGGDRLIFTAAGCWPGLFAWLNRRRRARRRSV